MYYLRCIVMGKPQRINSVEWSVDELMSRPGSLRWQLQRICSGIKKVLTLFFRPLHVSDRISCLFSRRGIPQITMSFVIPCNYVRPLRSDRLFIIFTGEIEFCFFFCFFTLLANRDVRVFMMYIHTDSSWCWRHETDKTCPGDKVRRVFINEQALFDGRGDVRFTIYT